MHLKPPLSIRAGNHLGDRLPVLDLYADPLEIVMSQPGAHSLSVFLTPETALRLAEALIHAARNEIARKAALP